MLLTGEYVRKRQEVPVHTIVTHHNPHIDELIAIFFLVVFGKKLFPGIEKSARVYIDAGSETYNGMTADQGLGKGLLFLGVGGGMFDEHPTGHKQRKEGECAATLAANYLGLNDPCFERLLRYARNRDLHGNDEAGTFGLASLIDALTRESETPEVSERVVNLLLMAHYNEQKAFYHVAAEEFQYATTNDITLQDRSHVIVAHMNSDDKRVHSYGFHKEGVGVFVVARQSGHIQVFPNKRKNLDMTGVIAAIRSAEAASSGKEIPMDELCLEGKVVGAECWHYQEETGIIMNGSLTAKCVPPTKLSLEDVLMCVVKGLKDTAPKTYTAGAPVK